MRSPRTRRINAAHAGCMATRATADATVVNDTAGMKHAKWPASSTPAPTDSHRERRPMRRSARPPERPRAKGTTTPDAIAMRQKAMASEGAAAALMSGAAVDVPSTPTTSSNALPAGGRCNAVAGSLSYRPNVGRRGLSGRRGVP